jgi:hypothetical protein
MTPAPYSHYIGKKLVDVIDQIKEQADNHGHFTVNVLDQVLRNNIDHNGKRLNLRVDDNSIIQDIFIG